MGNLLNMDNGFFHTIGKICDLFLLSIVWLLCCIPIITIGPANTALYYATVKVIRRERGYLMSEFFKSFRLNFKKGAIVGVVMTIASVLLAIDIVWAKSNIAQMPKYGPIFLGVFIAIAFLLACVGQYIFPILSRFDMTIKQLVKAAAFMAARHLPSSLAMVAINAICIILIGGFVPYLIVILPALDILLISFLMERILKKYTPQSEGDPEETGKDEWYLE